jgi:thiamine pyrophosphate-dependent acetolactate synthase large subunit-like protein
MTSGGQGAGERGLRDAMPLAPALRVLADLRRQDHIVVTCMGSAREWPKLSEHALDFHYVPSTMGGAVPLGLGLALAQPRREVLVVSGDGALLMNLGCLVTVVDSGATNLSVALVDNGVYEVTGGQRTAAVRSGVDFAGVARAIGVPNVGCFRSLDDWRRGAGEVFARPGPRFVQLVVEPVREDYALEVPCPMSAQIERLGRALGVRR